MGGKTLSVELNNIWITSDWHLGHDREFIWKPRGFESLSQMENTIVERHNSLVAQDDDVYVLGDLMLGPDITHTLKLLLQMNGRFHIVRGNHDTDRRWEAYKQLSNVVEVDNAIYLKYRKYHFYMSHYPSLTGNLEKENLHQMTLNLFGHTHSKEEFYEDRPYMYNVSMDAHNCFPCNLNDIIHKMKIKVLECEVAAADGVTPHDTCVKAGILKPYEAWQAADAYRNRYCDKCVHYRISCGGPGLLRAECPPDIKYRRDPPDGGYYG